MFSECFGSLNKHQRLREGGLGFRCCITFNVHERICERDLEFYLLLTQHWCRGQVRDLVEGTGQLRCCFYYRRTVQRPLSRVAPIPCSFFHQSGLGTMTRY